VFVVQVTLHSIHPSNTLKVIIGIMGNAYLEFLLLVAFYLMSYDRCDDKTTFVESFDSHSRYARTIVDGNHMDRVFLRWIRRQFRNITSSRHMRPCRALWICDSLHFGFASVSLERFL
jgi:hypothetical protein